MREPLSECLDWEMPISCSTWKGARDLGWLFRVASSAAQLYGNTVAPSQSGCNGTSLDKVGWEEINRFSGDSVGPLPYATFRPIAIASVVAAYTARSHRASRQSLVRAMPTIDIQRLLPAKSEPSILTATAVSAVSATIDGQRTTALPHKVLEY